MQTSVLVYFLEQLSCAS